jgi:hypothetical protein
VGDVLGITVGSADGIADGDIVGQKVGAPDGGANG